MTIFFEVDFCSGKVAGAAWAERRAIVRRSGSTAGSECHRGKTGRTDPPVFFNDRHLREYLVRFDVLIIEEDSGRMPEVGLYKYAFSAVM
jgi:hypothetical protein